MTTTIASQARPAKTDEKCSDYSVFFLCIIAFLLPVTVVLIPKSPAPLYLAGTILCVVTWMVQNRRFFPPIDLKLAAVFTTLCVYGALSSFWSIKPDETIEKLLKLVLFFVPTIAVFGLIRSYEREAFDRIMRWAVYGLSAGLALYVTDMLCGYKLFALINGENSKTVEQIQGKALYVFFATGLASLYYCWNKRNEGAKWIMIGAVQLITIVMIVDLSLNITIKMTQLMVLLGGLAFWLTPIAWLRKAVMAGCLVTLLCAPIFAIGIRHSVDGVMRTDGTLPRTFKSRIEIWDITARRTMEKPFFGWGLKTSPYMPNRGEKSVLYKDMKIVHLHPHNGVLEMWFELGFVGISIMAAFLFVLFGRIEKIMGENRQKCALMALCVCFAYILPSFGLWQTWFMSALAGFGLIFVAALRATQKPDMTIRTK